MEWEHGQCVVRHEEGLIEEVLKMAVEDAAIGTEHTYHAMIVSK